MRALLAQLLRSPWLAALIDAGLWLLLGLAVLGLRGKAPEFHEADSLGNPAHVSPPLSKLDVLFWQQLSTRPVKDTNALNPFFTRHFIPSPTPPTPPPPAPTTKSIDVSYQGFYETSDGPKHAVMKLGDAFIDSQVGSRIATNWFVAQATVQAVTLTNTTSQTNIVPLNAKKQIEVPIR